MIVEAPRVGSWASSPCRISSVRQEIPGVATFEFAYDQARGFQPGQFNMMYLPGFGEAALSISSDSENHATFSHTVRRLGNVTSALFRLGVGDQAGVRGPFGTAWPLHDAEGGDLVIASGGLGIAPLRPVVYELTRRRDRYGRVAVLCGARTPNDLLYAGEFEAWRAAGIEVAATVDMDTPAWTGAIGVVPGLIEELDLDFRRATLFTCGPEIMMRFTIREAIERGGDPRKIFLSMERNMNCGMGFCGRCQIGPIVLCRDGPVVCYDAVAPLLNLEDL